MCVCLFWIHNRICPTESTSEGGPTESSPTTQATRHPGPRCSSCPLSPHTYVMHPASGQYPPPSSCPVQISYKVSGLPPPCLPVLHIYLTPTNMNPSNPTYKLCYFVNSNNLIQIVTLNRSSSLLLPPCLPVSASLTYLSGFLPLTHLILQ